MTIICGIATDDGTFIGSDTLLCAGSRVFEGIPKWYCYRNWAVALAGDWRAANIVNNNKEFLLAKLKNENEFIDRLYELLEEKDIGKLTEGDFTRNFGQNILLAKKDGPVFDIDIYLSITEMPFNELVARGTGQDFAIGAAYIAKGSPENIMKKAIEAACEYSTDCGGEIFLKKL